MNSTEWPQQVVFIYLYVYRYVIIIIKEKEDRNLRLRGGHRRNLREDRADII